MLLLSGTVGVGKTTVALEINDALAERGIPNAAVDIDAVLDRLGIEHFTVENGDRPIRSVAEEVLRRAGWIG